MESTFGVTVVLNLVPYPFHSPGPGETKAWVIRQHYLLPLQQLFVLKDVLEHRLGSDTHSLRGEQGPGSLDRTMPWLTNLLPNPGRVPLARRPRESLM